MVIRNSFLIMSDGNPILSDGLYYSADLAPPVVNEADSTNTDKFAIGVALGVSPLGTDAHPSRPIISQSVPSPGNTIQNIVCTVFIDDYGIVYLYEGIFSELRGYELADDMVIITSSTTTTNNAGEGSPYTPTSYHACIAYGTASSPLGLWTFQGIVLGIVIVSSTTSCSGIFLLNDTYYLVHHTADSVDGGHFGHSIVFDVMTFDDNQFPPKINKITQTHRPAGGPEPTRSIALAAVAGSVNTTPIQYWMTSVNDGKIPVNPLPPDYWSSYAATDSPVTNQLTLTWNTTVTLDGTRMVLFADQDAGSNIGVPPPSSWGVEYLGNVRFTHSTIRKAIAPESGQ
ncbi:glycosyl hydrolase family 43 protein [Seiridium cupressi]